MKPQYRWIICVDVHPNLVADGLDLTSDAAHCALCRAFPYANGAHIEARTILAPDPDEIAQEMGYEDANDRETR